MTVQEGWGSAVNIELAAQDFSTACSSDNKEQYRQHEKMMRAC